ncbi:MAG: LysM peptidoglycan-binding domain-containing protein [Oscillospiraceae bacterium]|nr:LysM peptidoglycan-binding domain-containing protein [Oscillospiraceae bacterium]
MKKRIISLLLAVVLFAALPVMGAQVFAEAETVDYKIGAETIKMICEKQGIDYEFCKAAILKLNPSVKDDFSNLKFGDTIKLPKTNQAAADILGVALPDKLKPSSAATGASEVYTVVDGDTLIGICTKKGLTYEKCKTAIMKLNGWNDYNLLAPIHTGDKIKLPKSDADAAVIAASASSGSATGSATSTGSTGTATGTGTTVVGGNTVSYLVPHVVTYGETIYGICADNGVNFSKYVDLIMAVSGIKYATDLRVGNVVYLPSAKSAAGAIAITSHVVKTGETTYGICQDLGISYSARYNMITALNPGKNLDSIHTGDVLLFPAGGGTIPSGGGSVVPSGGGSVVPSSSSSGYGGGYTPAAGKDSTTPAAVKPKEGVMYYITEITVKKDDTAYALVKAAGFDYTTYYADVLLSFNNLSSFDNLKEGDKLLMVSSSATGAKYAVTGVKVKDGDTVTKMCVDAGITYNNNVNLIAKLNPGVNINSIKTGDIIVLPKKLA